MTTQIVGGNAATNQAGQVVTDLTTQPQQQTGMAVVNESLPEYMRGDAKGTDLIGQYVSPPILQIVQSNHSDLEVKRKVGESAIIILGTDQVVVQALGPNGEAQVVQFVPLFFYPEYIAWNPRSVKTQAGLDLPAVRERTTVTNSELARRCRSFDNNVRNYLCPEAPPTDREGRPNLVKCQEHLNFILMLLGHELTGTPVLLSFSRTSYKTGLGFCKTIKMRNAPMHGMIFDLSVKPEKNEKGSWYGPDVKGSVTENGLSAFVDKEWYEYLKPFAEQLREEYNQGLLLAQYENDNNEPAPVAGNIEQRAAQPQQRF